MFDQILQELYIGKTPELLEIERLIGRIRRSHTKASFLTNAMYDKDMERINRIFEDFFGFEVFSLMVDRSTAANAYTLPISSAIDIGPQYRVKKNLLATDKGFKYKKEAGYCCVVHIYNNLLFSDNFTDAEVLAIILHEIGHNFESVINQTIYYTSDAINIIDYIVSWILFMIENSDDFNAIMTYATTSSLIVAIQSNKFKKMSDALLKYIEKDPNLRVIFGIASIYFDTIMELRMNMNYLLSEVLKYGRIPAILKRAVMRKIRKPLGVTSENTADSFATIYGYGAELSSAMLKFSSNNVGLISQKIIYSIPVLSQIIAIYDLPLDIMVSVFDEHPSGIERAKFAKANLQRELKEAYLDPKMKAQIQKQINEIDDSISKYEAMSKRIDNPKSFRALWDIFLYSLKGESKLSNRRSEKVMGDIDKIFADTKLR